MAARNWNSLRRSAGLTLFWLSWLLWGVLLAVPLMIDEGPSMAASAGAIVVVSELCFAASLLLLGRPFYDAFKANVHRQWARFTRR